MVELTGKPARELHLVDGARELRHRLRGLGHELGAVLPHLLSKLKGGTSVGQALVRSVHRRDVALCLGKLGHHRARRLGVVPKRRFRTRGLKLTHASTQLVDMQVGLNLAQTLLKSVQLGGRHRHRCSVGH